MKRMTVMTLIALAIAPMLVAQMKETDMRDAAAAANNALPTLASLAASAPEAAGLTQREAAAARLEAPLRVLFVPLDRLKAYRGGDDPRTLLTEINSVFFPVSVDGSVRSSITVQRGAQGWTATDFGQAELAKRIAAAGSGGLLIRIPALNLFFVGQEGGGTLTLTAISDVRGTDLRSGQSAPAATIFATLASIAQQQNGDPT